MSRDVTRTFHPWPPGGTRQRGGSSRTAAGRLTGHALGPGARLTRVQPERSGSRIAAQTGPEMTS